MADCVLRDQCIHGRYEAHEAATARMIGANGRADAHTPITMSCPGGREVTIDYEAAIGPLRNWLEYMLATAPLEGSDAEWWDRNLLIGATLTIDAAIGPLLRWRRSDG